MRAMIANGLIINVEYEEDGEGVQRHVVRARALLEGEDRCGGHDEREEH